MISFNSLKKLNPYEDKQKHTKCKTYISKTPHLHSP